jgi:hypothetical protein
MIRPFTLICALLAAGSGLYLYDTKHKAQLLDRKIRHVQEITAATREHGGVLRAEYALLNDPQRLAELASTHLPALRSTLPAQWSTMAELGKRLPPVGAPTTTPSPLEPDGAAVARIEPIVAPLSLPTRLVAASPATTLAPSPTSPPRQSSQQVAAQAPRPPVRVAAARPQAPALAPTPLVPVQFAQTQAQAVPQGPARQRQQLPTTSVFAAVARPPTSVAAGRNDAYAAPPATTAEAIARIARGAPVDPSLPVVASALGMARSMVPASPLSPANAASLYTVGSTR